MKLRAIVKHSYDNVPYYHTLFKELKLSPDDIKKTDDLQKLPVLKKKDFINLSLKERLAVNINLKQCQRFRTSGTTGIPLTVYRQKKDDMFQNLQQYRWQLEYGGKITNRQVLLGESIHIPRYPNTWEKIGIFKTKRISPFEDPKKQIEEIQKFAPQVAYGIPSCVRVLAKEILERGLRRISIPLIFTGGEFLDDNTREFAGKAFGAELFSQYGSIEVGKIARECVKHSSHVWSDRVLVEVTRDGEPASFGEEGEITVTNLNQYAMPFLRYNLQDMGYLMENYCSCGDPFPMIRLTSGRKSDFVRLPNGSTIGALAVYNILCDIQGIRQFQVIQENPNRFIFKMVRDSQFTDETTRKVKELICKRLGEVEIDVVEVDTIPREKSGKFRPFIPMKTLTSF